MSMVEITKKQLAAELGISAARISQYLKEGLPACDNGRLDRLRALNWVKSNIAGDAGVKAARILRAGSGDSSPLDRAVMALARKMVKSAGALATISAHEGGADRELAERIGKIVSFAFLIEISDWLAACGVEPVASDPDGDIWPEPDTECDQVNWAGLGPPGGMR